MIQVSLDYTLFIQILQFLLIVYISNKLILQPIKTLMDKRDEKIMNINSSTDDLLISVETSRLAYENKLIEIKKEISVYQESVRMKASKEVESVLSAAKTEIEKHRISSEKEIEKAYSEAKKELNKEINELSKSIYKELSGVA